jgi:3,4-dihydroxy-2-butanone 4-phosphate synthase
MVTNSIDKITAGIQALQKGEMIILTDHPNRENEADIIFPACTATSEKITFLLNHCSGIICLVLLPSQVEQLQLSLMVPEHENTSHNSLASLVSIEAKYGVTSGISAADRTKTILTAVNPHAEPSHLVKPGHVFPLMAKTGGVLEREGHTEGSVDLVKLAGFHPSAVLCELMNSDGTMMRGDNLKHFAEKQSLITLSIQDIIEYRLYHKM